MQSDSQRVEQPSSSRELRSLILRKIFGLFGWIYTLAVFLSLCIGVALVLGYMFWLWALNSAADHSTSGLTLDMASWHYYIEMLKSQLMKH